MASLSHKRGTRAQINAAAAANGLRYGEVYLITDEGRLTVGTSVNTHVPAAKQGEEGSGADPWSWIKLATDVANSSVTLADVTGLSFNAAANTTYLVEVLATMTSAALTTGVAMALDIPSGTVAGFGLHPITAATTGSFEQIADSATTGATSGVRSANTNTPIRAKYMIAVGATSGPVQLKFRSEIAASAVTIKAGLTAMGWRVI